MTFRIPNMGFILPSAGILYGFIGAAIVIAGLSIAVKVQTSRLAASKAETERVTLQFRGFVLETQRLGEEALKDAAIKVALGRTNKEKADAENVRTIAELRAHVRGLRNDATRAGSGAVPAAPAGSNRPEIFAVDRTEYQRAYGKLVEGVRGLALEGSETTVDLDTAKGWAQK